MLDAGCGTGALLAWLGRLAGTGRVTAIDLAPAGLAVCRRQQGAFDLGLASVVNLPFAEKSFDLVVSMDVLQHLTEIQADGALREMARVLRPDGRLLVRTNAAFGRGKVVQREAWRLYRRSSLGQALVKAGFDLELVTPVNCLQGLWASFAGRTHPQPNDHHLHNHPRAEGHDGPADAERPEWGVAGLGLPSPVHPLKNRLLRNVLRAEAEWLRRVRRPLPFGHSLYGLARRRS
ncbi:MAG: class I SAM-dependent methyltransferase [Acidimicrobiales bacterium]